MKITQRQQKIVDALAQKLHALEDSLPFLAAKGVVHYALDHACGKWSVELSAVQEFPKEKKIEFMGDVLSDLRERLSRFHVPDDRAKEISDRMLDEYKAVM